MDESSEFLPLVYEPASITAYWGKRPRAVASRIVQLLSVAGGFLSRIAMDVINKKVKEVTGLKCTHCHLSDINMHTSFCLTFWIRSNFLDKKSQLKGIPFVWIYIRF